jgi:hypothetical protein
MEYDENMILAKKNIASLAVGLSRFESLRQEDVRRIANLEHQVTVMNQLLQKLALDLAIARAMSVARGPTQ